MLTLLKIWRIVQVVLSTLHSVLHIIPGISVKKVHRSDPEPIDIDVDGEDNEQETETKRRFPF